jgi:TldD protein
MTKMNRRSFIRAGAAAAGAAGGVLVWPGSWLEFARAGGRGYFEAEFGITDAICRKLLAEAMSKGGDFADLYFEHTLSNWVILQDGQVNQAYGNVDLGIGIRTVKGDQVGYGFTQDLTAKAMLAAASTAATIADSPARPVAPQFAKIKAGDYYPTTTLFTAVSVSSKVPVVQAVNDRCLDRSRLIVKVECGLHDQQKRIMVVTSEGKIAEDLQPRSYLFASVVAEKNGKSESAWWNLGGRREFSFYSSASVERVANEVVDRALRALEATQPPAGEMPVVLGPGITGILLHEAIGHGMEADFNRKKVSTYCTMIGRKVAEPFVTIIDDGTNPYQVGSINVDDEGVPSQRTVLVEDGILRSYLYDRISANHYQVKPTGNGRRESYRYYPQPRMRNTYMQAGKARPDDVIGSVKKGIYVQDIANGEVKIGEGDFAFYVSQGSMIEGGKLTAPIKDVNIMGNGPKMLTQVRMVANDLRLAEGGVGACGKGGQAVPVSFGLPTVLVNSMTVGGTRQGGA